MKKILLLLLCGLIFLVPGALIIGEESDLGTHELTGPVEVQWVRQYDGPGSRDDHPFSLAVSPDGSTLFVTGFSYNSGLDYDFDYATLAYDAATGEEVWSARYDGPQSYSNAAFSLAVSPDGSTLFVTGTSAVYGPNRDDDYATLAYDAATGEEIWSTRYDEKVSGEPNSLAVSPDGSTVFVTGGSDNSETGLDYATLAYDGATGEQIWSARYDGIGSWYPDVASSLAVSPDGSTVFVTGRSWDEPYCDYATLAYDAATGEEIWSARFDGTESSVGRSLAVSPDGSTVFVTGYVGGAYPDYATLAYDADTGEEIWSARYDGPESSGDIASSLAVSPDGSTVFVTGRSYTSGTDSDYATLAYDADTGEEIWSARFDGIISGRDEPSSLVVSPDGSTVIVTGLSYGEAWADYATLAYDAATGEEIWSARFDGIASGRDEPASLAVSPDGSTVFVTGKSKGFGIGLDYATIAYSVGLTIEIDIILDSINPRIDFVVPVALLGSEDFDVGDVDLTTLRFGPDGASPAHDLTDTWIYTDHLQDVNLDGFMDLKMHFEMENTGIACGDTFAILTGAMLNGRRLQGEDTIMTVGCGVRRTPPE